MIKTNGYNPYTYMQLAIEEMKKSNNEPRLDGKIPPKVGAIILFPEGRVVRAHRGELREGDHAEFTLLERKLGHEKLDDCFLFTTLEPCVRRNHPKIGCSKRTVNARIKTVYVGIQDPDPTVAGKGIKLMEDQSINITMFDRDLQKIIENENIDFLKQAKKRAKLVEKDEIETEFELAIPRTDFNQFSEKALQKFISEAKLDYKLKDIDFQNYLADLGAMRFDEKTNTFRTTGIGILLFGKNPRTKYNQAVLKAYVDYGKNNIEPKEFGQPLVLIPDLVEEWLKKVLPLSKDTTSFKRKDVPDFPINVLREAVINALIHRDYTIESASSSLEIDNDKIIVKSPGAPVPSISIEQLNTFKAPSIRRNPIITYVFNLMDYVEETGFGMKSLKSLNSTYGLPLPEYLMEDPFLTLTFPRNMEVVRKVSHNANLSKLNDEELTGYEFIKLKEKVIRKEYQEHFGFDSDKKAERHLKKMVDLKLIIRKGSGPSTYYEINPT
jgi:ATP-dependent DNA helicase RecG